MCQVKQWVTHVCENKYIITDIPECATQEGSNIFFQKKVETRTYLHPTSYLTSKSIEYSHKIVWWPSYPWCNHPEPPMVDTKTYSNAFTDQDYSLCQMLLLGQQKQWRGSFFLKLSKCLVDHPALIHTNQASASGKPMQRPYLLYLAERLVAVTFITLVFLQHHYLGILQILRHYAFSPALDEELVDVRQKGIYIFF